MADTEMKTAQGAAQAGAELQEKGKDVSKLLSSFGGFNAIRGFMPDADNMNPARKAAKDVFLTWLWLGKKKKTPGVVRRLGTRASSVKGVGAETTR